MGEVAWVKLSAATFEDEKLEMVEGMPEGDALLLMWIKLICLARKTNDQGLIYITADIPYTEDMLAIKFKKPAPLVRMALATFKKLKMIEIFPDSKIWLVNWAKYQYLEGLEKVREQTRVRTERYRRHMAKRLKKGDIESKRNSVTESNVTVTSRSDDDVTHCDNTDSREIEIREEGAEQAESESKALPTESKSEVKKEIAPDVFLTQSEYETLVSDFSESETKVLIDELSNALGNTIPKNRYKSHYKTLRNWIKKRRLDLERKGVKTPITLRVGEKQKRCPDCGKQYWGSACVCGWGEQLLREGK